MSDAEPPFVEPFVIDRELRRTAKRWRSFRRRLRAGEGFDLDPFDTSRPALGKSTFQALLEIPGDPVAPRVARWVYRLAEQRINRNWLVAIARKRSEVPVEEGHETSHAELVRRALAEPVRRREWLERALVRSEPIHALVVGLWERRSAIADQVIPASTPRALGYDSAPSENLAGLADAWLQATEPLLPALGSGRAPEWWLSHALGERVDAGWPAHLNPDSVSDLFRDTRLLEALDLDPGPLPRALAPASFMRALARLGAAFLVASAPGDQPFSIAYDAYGLERYRHGALLGSLPLNPKFVMRRLRATRELARRAIRSAAATLLIESRLAALRVLLGEAALGGRKALRDAYTEGIHRCLGVELPGDAAGVIVKLRLDDPQRFSGLLLAFEFAGQLRDAHDDDWFRNPRAIDQLRSEAAMPPETRVERVRLETAVSLAASTLHDLLN